LCFLNLREWNRPGAWNANDIAGVFTAAAVPFLANARRTRFTRHSNRIVIYSRNPHIDKRFR